MLLLLCGAVCGGGGQRGDNGMHLALGRLSVTSPDTHKWIVPFQLLIPGWMGLYTFQDPVGLSNELSCEAGSFSHHYDAHRFS